jgi:hypothetical protein
MPDDRSLHGAESISLRLVTRNGANGPKSYVGSLRSALHEFVDDNIKDPADTGDARSNGPEKWIIAIVIERGEKYGPGEVVAGLRDMAAVRECVDG